LICHHKARLCLPENPRVIKNQSLPDEINCTNVLAFEANKKKDVEKNSFDGKINNLFVQPKLISNVTRL
jgi:hypothetical protein